MINKYKQIALLYFKNPIFIFVAVLFIMGAILLPLIAKHAIQFLEPLVGYSLTMLDDDSATFMLVLGVWFLLELGTLLKRHFANYRSSLLPNYQAPHIEIAFVFYIAFIFISVLTVKSFAITLAHTSTAQAGVFLYSFTLVNMFLILGYLSIGSFLFAAYILLIFGANLAATIMMVGYSRYGNLTVLLLNIGLLFALIYRLKHLKEDYFEYPYLLAWPQREFIKNQVREHSLVEKFTSGIMRLLKKEERELTIPKYPRARSIFSRAAHWDIIEHSQIKMLWLLGAIVTPLYILDIKYLWNNDVPLVNTYANFVLFALSPALIALCANFQKIGFWDFDLLKPVKKEDFLKERAINLLGYLLLWWVLFCIYFAVLPNFILNISIFSTLKFWAFMAFTGAFSFFTLAWLAFMSCLSKTKWIIINGLILSFIVQAYFIFAILFTAKLLLWHSLFYFLSGALFAKIAYKKWGQREFK